MDSEGHRLIAHPWSRLFVASVLNRRYTPYNLVDMYCRVAGVRPPQPRLWYGPSAAGHERARAMLAEAGVRDGERLVAFQPGASSSIRQWPVASFIALGRMLRARLGVRIVLLGTAGEAENAAAIAAGIGHEAVNVAGCTDLPALAALLERTALLVTGDTGPMHLAVAVGTPVVAFFFGPAFVWETGPYAADSIVLQTRIACSPCHHTVRCLAPICREELTPEMAFWAVHDRLAQDYATLARRARNWATVDVHRIGFDDDGMYDPVPLVSRPDTVDVLRLIYREMWRTALDGVPEDAVALARARERARRRLGDDLPDLTMVRRALEALAARAREGCALATRLAATAATVMSAPGSAPGHALEEIERLAVRIEAVDAAIERQGFVDESVGTMARTFAFGKENVSETKALDVLAGETADLYAGLGRWAGLSLRLLDAVAPCAPRIRMDAGEGSSAAR